MTVGVLISPQNILQQVDQRQVHLHTDHNAALEAAAAVTVANERVAAVENQALQAVLQARGQAEQTVAQVQALVREICCGASVGTSERKRLERATQKDTATASNSARAAG